VAGTSGSGKSTLARELAGICSVPHLELDSVFHQQGWAPLPPDEFRDRVARFISGDGWVVDGNYSAVRDLVWERADTVVWLDLPKHLVMRRLIWRTVRRVVTRKELWNGNRESWRAFFTLDPEQSIIIWGWTTHARNRDRYLTASADQANAHLTFIRLRSPRAVKSFLDQARAGAAGPERSPLRGCPRTAATPAPVPRARR
jgi:adenylate kinase family enzyme